MASTLKLPPYVSKLAHAGERSFNTIGVGWGVIKGPDEMGKKAMTGENRLLVTDEPAEFEK